MKRKKNIIILVILMFAMSTISSYAWTTSSEIDPYNYPGSITYYIVNSSYSSYIEDPAESWDDCSELGISRSYVMNGALCKIYVINNTLGYYGVAGQNSLYDKWIYLAEEWQDASSLIKEETVAHEFGHTLGLGHTQSYNVTYSVMRKEGFNWKAYPLSDDKTGISNIY